MNIIALIISILLLIGCIFYYRKRNAISPMVIFFLLWTFILILSNLNLYGIYKPSFQAYLLITLMLLFFSIGVVFNIVIKKQKVNIDLQDCIEIETQDYNRAEYKQMMQDIKQKYVDR